MDCFECVQIRAGPANALLSTTSGDYGENVQMNLTLMELRECPDEPGTRATERMSRRSGHPCICDAI